jgi:hypothetical protein
MQIVPQSATFKLASFPFLSLPEPPRPKLLAAPRIAGLLSARIPQAARLAKIEIVRPFDTIPDSVDELLARIGPIRSQEEMDEEICEMLEAHAYRIEQIRTAYTNRRAAQTQSQWGGVQ